MRSIASHLHALREVAHRSKRDPRESWFVRVGEQEHEHSSRFLKQDRCGTKVHVRAPEQFERWSLVVASAMNPLVQVPSHGQTSSRPWERRRDRVSTRHVRRVMAGILPQIGTPARVIKPRGKSPDRPVGVTVIKAARFDVVRRPGPVPRKPRKKA